MVSYSFRSITTGELVPVTVIKENVRTVLLEVRCHKTGNMKIIKRRK